MIVQIYSATTPEEARKLCELNVDNIGIIVGREAGTYTVKYDDANKIFDEIKSPSKKVAFSKSNDIVELEEICEKTNPDILHIGASEKTFSKEDLKLLKEKYPNIKLMISIYVKNRESIKEAVFWQDVVDYILLDSSDSTSSTGGTGKTNDWQICEEMVDSVETPVILAGGLSVENVVEAIKTVNPAGVDSMTKTNIEGGRLKDFEKVKEFVRLAKH